MSAAEQLRDYASAEGKRPALRVAPNISKQQQAQREQRARVVNSFDLEAAMARNEMLRTGETCGIRCRLDLANMTPDQLDQARDYLLQCVASIQAEFNERKAGF